MLSYEFDQNKKEFYESKLCDLCTFDLQEQISIRTIALDLLKNWNSYRHTGSEIHKEYLFSITELVDFFYIRIDKQDEFTQLLKDSYMYFQNSKDKKGFANVAHEICGNLYFCVPNLLKIWPLMEHIIRLSIYYIEKHEN